MGQNNKDRALDLRSTAITLTAIPSVLSFLLYILAAAYYFLSESYTLALVFGTYSIIGAFHLLNTQFLPTLFRTNSDFNVFSRINLYIGVVNLLSVLIVFWLGFKGLLIRAVLLSVIQFSLFMTNLTVPLQFNFSFNYQNAKDLFKIGIPIFIVGQIGPLWMTISNNVLIEKLGTKQFGLFALSTIVLTSFSIIPRSFSQVIYPRMASMYGANISVSEIVKKNIRPAFFQFILVLIIAILSSLSLPYIVPALLPKYSSGIEAAQWMLFVPVVYSMGVMNNLFNVIRKMKEYTLALALGPIIGLSYIIINLNILENFDLVIFPKGLILGGLCQQVISGLFIRSFYFLYERGKPS
jgi:O-antigen/teichoic acid export membrane protein